MALHAYTKDGRQHNQNHRYQLFNGSRHRHSHHPHVRWDLTRSVYTPPFMSLHLSFICRSVPLPPTSVTSSTRSRVDIPATLAPTLGLLLLLALAAGVVLWRRRKRLRRAQHSPRGIEGGLSKHNKDMRDSGLEPLMEEMEHTHLPAANHTKNVPNPFDSSDAVVRDSPDQCA